MRSDDLLAAVFPAQVQCQDNALPVPIEVPDHPLVFETVRDCLTEATELDSLQRVLAGIEREEIEMYARDTVQPSVFAHQILNAMPYAFLDDAPLEERRARAVSLRRALPEDARDLGSLNAQAIREESENAWPRVRDASELHDALLVLGLLPKADIFRADRSLQSEDMEEWFAELVQAGRAFLLGRPEGRFARLAAERIPLVRAAFPEASLGPQPPEGLAPPEELSREDAILSLVRGRVECSGDLTTAEIADQLGLSGPEASIALAQLEAEGLVLRGYFRAGVTEEEFCDRRILARIHRATLSRLRREVEPVSQATFLRFLFRWQHVEPASQLRGEGGLLNVIEQLQSFESASGAWESDLLAARIADYQPFHLDRLCLGGEVVWGRLTGRQDNNLPPGQVSLSRTTPIALALREALDWLLDQPQPDEKELSLPGAAGEMLTFLSQRGASFLPEIVASTRRLPSDVEETLWRLAATGRVTADSPETLRLRINGNSDRRRRASSRRRSVRASRRPGYSRWSLLEAVNPPSDPVEPRARQLLRRYGVLFPEFLAREPTAPRWRDLVRFLRRLEARDEILGGRFVARFVGEQFALPEVVETLRGVKNSQPRDELVVVSACDPLNLAGILTPGERVPAMLGNVVVFRDGVPLSSLESGNLVNVDEATLAQVRSLLHPPVLKATFTTMAEAPATL